MNDVGNGLLLDALGLVYVLEGIELARLLVLHDTDLIDRRCRTSVRALKASD